MKKQTVNSFLSLQLSPLAPTISNQVFLDCFFQTSLGYHEPNFYTNDSKNMFSAAIFSPTYYVLKDPSVSAGREYPHAPSLPQNLAQGKHSIQGG